MVRHNGKFRVHPSDECLEYNGAKRMSPTITRLSNASRTAIDLARAPDIRAAGVGMLA